MLVRGVKTKIALYCDTVFSLESVHERRTALTVLVSQLAANVTLTAAMLVEEERGAFTMTMSPRCSYSCSLLLVVTSYEC
ncbi:hypothetical protein F2P81_025603 [Scophthalmus maximus]|uniref:Uncharacterized protein n=1 Tax=Scophthalmus maximus TaxID=52904 RepID=A0A6A4RT03_SCOMX|nr:hypothetical protein F2P81_025603 [Scophthalmus maximus]